MAGEASALGAGTLGWRYVGFNPIRLLAHGARTGISPESLARLVDTSPWSMVQAWYRRPATKAFPGANYWRSYNEPMKSLAIWMQVSSLRWLTNTHQNIACNATNWLLVPSERSSRFEQVETT